MGNTALSVVNISGGRRWKEIVGVLLVFYMASPCHTIESEPLCLENTNQMWVCRQISNIKKFEITKDLKNLQRMK